jgi:hypothetical protein
VENEAIRIVLRDVALPRQTHSKTDIVDFYHPKRSIADEHNGRSYCFQHAGSQAIPRH